MNPPKPVILCILDGWGHREAPDANAIAQAHTPTWDYLCATYPYGVIHASEGHVGLPAGQMGNSEVGHMNIGAGRVVMQDLPRIDAAIADGSLEKNPALTHLIDCLKASGGTCHLMGLLSDGGVHAHISHIIALAEIVAKAGVRVALHAFLDGRDTPPRSALGYLAQLEAATQPFPLIHLATLSGRYYAMDRDKRWDRVSKAYDCLTQGMGASALSSKEAIEASYAANVGDEFILPHRLGDYSGMKDNDGLLMANFRADRARQLLDALLKPNFDGFARTARPAFSASAGMVEYSDSLNAFIPPIFVPESLSNILGEVVANQGLAQLRIAETEKYAHVTFFMSGGREAPFAKEERILVPSPNVATYDLQPEMSAPIVTDKLVEAIQSNRFDLMIVNYANTDMVGHSGDLAAAKKAVEAVDACLKRVYDACITAGGAMLITADHGNAESMQDEQSGQAHTAHTLNLVPCLLVSRGLKGKNLTLSEGKLADIAPTILTLMGLEVPPEMTGRSLIEPSDARAALCA